MPDNAILQIQSLGFPWETADPFLFCVHHDDAYPKGNGAFGPAASLAGRNIGQDFGRKDGWSMYHGETVPGFPSHPHRGFETVTIVRQGLTDHSDSLGAAARFGGGDVQWLTAGKGIVHSEMFPLLDADKPNPLELFQIWLNLPARNKMCEPHFTMLWAEDIPHRLFDSGDGAVTEVAVIAGRLAQAAEIAEPLPPPPDSWASQPEADLAIWTLRMDPGARWTLPAAVNAAARRRLYFFAGASVSVAGQAIAEHAAIELRAASAVELVNTGVDVAECLLLQGRPIGEPVAQYGPFVMNTEAELRQAFDDYRRTEFGGWPWPDHAPVHGPERVRFARHADGRVETLATSREARALMPNVVPGDVAAADDGEVVASSVVLDENSARGMQ
ncbi:pirin family protein [Scleromatobacter humisilvae]|uniref:Pirin family protein n=1 Tax=Scleromatobacter humisilvae TaxID=2897159 RepID=A0A9X2BYG3_9BURK|nr:pirin family protein [Scleromatobacter humisilvae]MCK9685593.1 pirin family protein [Scleromatobacter humisilvae]